MPDAWGGSWGVSWGISWGSDTPPPPPPEQDISPPGGGGGWVIRNEKELRKFLALQAAYKDAGRLDHEADRDELRQILSRAFGLGVDDAGEIDAAPAVDLDAVIDTPTTMDRLGLIEALMAAMSPQGAAWSAEDEDEMQILLLLN